MRPDCEVLWRDAERMSFSLRCTPALTDQIMDDLAAIDPIHYMVESSGRFDPTHRVFNIRFLNSEEATAFCLRWL